MKRSIPALLCAATLLLPGACYAGTDNAKWKQLDEQVKVLLKQQHAEQAIPLAQQALDLAIRNQYAEAGPLLKRALAVQEIKFGQANPILAPDLDHLAQLYRMIGQENEALVYERQAEAVRKSSAASGN